jgi:hypothetical protein
MTPLPLFKQSQTTLQISQYLLPLALVTGVACLLLIGTYFAILLPSQSRLTEATLAYERIQHTYKQNTAAWNTQETLNSVWEQMPPRKGFIGLGVAISDLAKSHNIRIPEIGYDIKSFRHKLATKGTMSFKAAGRYKAIRKFIYELESKWPQLFIEKLTAERAKKPNEVAFSITVSTFLKEKEDGVSPRQGSSL